MARGIAATENMPDQRPPLLSDREIGEMSVTENGSAGENKYRMARRVRAFYEDKIKSGELMVVKTTTFYHSNSFIHCASCNWSMTWEAEGLCEKFKLCPGCSAKIVEG